MNMLLDSTTLDSLLTNNQIYLLFIKFGVPVFLVLHNISYRSPESIEVLHVLSCSLYYCANTLITLNVYLPIYTMYKFEIYCTWIAISLTGMLVYGYIYKLSLVDVQVLFAQGSFLNAFGIICLNLFLI